MPRRGEVPKLNALVQILVSSAEQSKLKDAAHAAGMPLSSYLRALLRQSLKEGAQTEGAAAVAVQGEEKGDAPRGPFPLRFKERLAALGWFPYLVERMAPSVAETVLSNQHRPSEGWDVKSDGELIQWPRS